MVGVSQSHIPCVIPCGGNCTRLGTGHNKCLIKVAGRPILEHIVSFWKGYGIERFIFVIGGNSAGEVARCIRQLSLARPIIIDRGTTLNLASAIRAVKPHIDGKFVLALGDCLNVGAFSDVHLDDGDCMAIGVLYTSEYELRKSYLVRLSGTTVVRVIEKPKTDVGLCGMGSYILSSKIFDYMDMLELLPQATSVDLTGAIQLAIDKGEVIEPMHFHGFYINVTYPQDLETLKEVIK